MAKLWQWQRISSHGIIGFNDTKYGSGRGSRLLEVEGLCRAALSSRISRVHGAEKTLLRCVLLHAPLGVHPSLEFA